MAISHLEKPTPSLNIKVKLLQFWVPAHTKQLLFFPSENWANIWWWIIYLIIVAPFHSLSSSPETRRPVIAGDIPQTNSVSCGGRHREKLLSCRGRSLPPSRDESHHMYLQSNAVPCETEPESSCQQEAIFSTPTFPISCPPRCCF